MNKFFHFIGQAIGFLLIVGGLAFCGFLIFQTWLGVQGVLDGVKTLSPDVYLPLIVTLTTAFFGLLAALYSQRLNREREIEAAHREKKTQVYVEFLEAISEIMNSSIAGTEVNIDDTATKFRAIRNRAVLWASPKVLIALSDFVKVESIPELEMWEVFDRLQREMRNDIGLTNKALEKDFFVKLILSNPEDLDQIRKKTRDK